MFKATMTKTPRLFILIIGLFASQLYPSSFYNSGYIYGGDLEISTGYYENNGTISAKNINMNVTTLKGSGSISGSFTSIKCDNYNLNGPLTGIKECTIKTKSLEATGTIKGDKVLIICDEFKFTGEIDAQECTIYTKNRFDHNALKRNMNGQYIVHIAKYGFESHTDKSLLCLARSIKDNLNLTQEDIEYKIKQARSFAALNKIDDIEILETVKKELEEKVIYVKERLHEKRGEAFNLKGGVLCGIIGSLGITAAIKTVLNEKYLAQKFHLPESAPFGVALLITLFSGFSFYLSYDGFYEWLLPHYKEKYKVYSLIVSTINESLMNPRIPEEEVIVL